MENKAYNLNTFYSTWKRYGIFVIFFLYAIQAILAFGLNDTKLAFIGGMVSNTLMLTVPCSNPIFREGKMLIIRQLFFVSLVGINIAGYLR